MLILQSGFPFKWKAIARAKSNSQACLLFRVTIFSEGSTIIYKAMENRIAIKPQETIRAGIIVR